MQQYLGPYGLITSGPVTNLEAELLAFRLGWGTENGLVNPKTNKFEHGLGRYEHLKRALKIMLPDLEWNAWMEWRFRVLCDDSYAVKEGNVTQRFVDWTGCAHSGKTHDVSVYALTWWLADPLNSIVVLTSTTASMIAARIWPCVTKYHNDVNERVGFAGHRIDSKTMIVWDKGNKKNAIFAKAVGGGETEKAAADIQGLHAKRILIVLDEATETRDAIMLAAENLMKNCEDFQCIKIGNAKSRFDMLGLSMEPKDGWGSVTVEDEEWRTRKGICLHFDGYKSPNVKAGRNVAPHLYSVENYKLALTKDQNTLEIWMYDRGFPPPESVSNTVFTETMVERYGGRGTHEFVSRRKTIAGLDPAFGGDTCRLRFALMGDLKDGKMGIQITEGIKIDGDPTSKLPLDHQIAQRVISECQKRGVSPEDFGMDATGTGRGVYAILSADWSSRIHRVEFGGSASDLPASEEDSRPSKDVYGNKVTELWFSCREFLKGGQLKGLDIPTVREFCTRTYELKGRKYLLEPKEKTKERLKRSPDDADCTAVICEVARRQGMTASTGITTRRDREWQSDLEGFSEESGIEVEELMVVNEDGGWAEE